MQLNVSFKCEVDQQIEKNNHRFFFFFKLIVCVGVGFLCILLVQVILKRIGFNEQFCRMWLSSLAIF